MDELDIENGVFRHGKPKITHKNKKKFFSNFLRRVMVEFLNKFNKFVKKKKFNVEKNFLSPNVSTHITFFT